MFRGAPETDSKLLEEEQSRTSRQFPRNKERVRLQSEEQHVGAGDVLFHADLKPGQVALTFDDGPHPTRTARILKILADAGVRATFFEVGASAERLPQITRAVSEQGHTIGSHTFRHPRLTTLSLPEAQRDIQSGRSMLETILGPQHGPVTFFRFPYGARNRPLQDWVKQEGMASFLWNMDSRDWKIRDAQALLGHVAIELDREKRGILLFHDIQEQTVIVLPYVLEALKARGFSTVVFIPH